MKKIIVILVLLISGFLVFRYLNISNDKNSALKKYQKDMVTTNERMDDFFDSVNTILDASDISKDTGDKLVSKMKLIEGMMVMVSSKDGDTQRLHTNMYDTLVSTRKAMKKLAKKAISKKELSKKIKALAKAYEEYLDTLDDWYTKYKVIDSEPEATKATTRYDKYDSYLDSTQE